MDLLSFGVILWTVYCNSSLIDNKVFKWQRYAIEYYEKRCKYDNYEKLEELKRLEFMPEMIKEYFEIVSRIDPKTTDPPSDDIYNNILNLKKYKLL